MDKLNGDIIIYQTEDGLTKIDVKIENETVWLSQQQMAELFSTSRTNIIEHINNIYSEEELDKNSTCQNFRQVALMRIILWMYYRDPYVDRGLLPNLRSMCPQSYLFFQP